MLANSSNSPIAHQPATAVSQIKPWIERFRAQYPMGGLVTALAAVHEGQYIVQATLSVGGINVTSGLAEAPTLEESEAIAQGIALDRFGLEKLAPAEIAVKGHATNGHATSGQDAANGSLNGSALPKMEEAMPAESAAEASVAPIPEALEYPEAASPAETVPAVEAIPPVEDTAPPEVPPSETPAKKTAKGKKAKPKPKSKAPKPKTQKSKANSQSDTSSPALANVPEGSGPDVLDSEVAADAEASEAPTFVADWSDDLAQIQVELKRLGWDANQSSDYLQRTYGKPSLDYITDHGELMDFLSYLRALPTHFDPGQFDEAPAVETEADVHIPADYEQPEPLTAVVEPPLHDLSEPAISESAMPEPAISEPVMSERMESEPAAPADNHQPPAEAIADATATPDSVAAEVPVPDVSVSEVSLDVSLPPTAPEEALAPAAADNFSHDFGGLSRDDMMQQSAAECKRLKWTNRQGSNFLSSRYGKPTRKDLSDQELWDFLQYLSSIAPVEETLKEKLPF